MGMWHEVYLPAGGASLGVGFPLTHIFVVGSKQHRMERPTVAGMRSFLALLALALALLPVHALGAVRSPLADAPPPARAHCRVFAVALPTHTRVLVLQNTYEQDALELFDDQPALDAVLPSPSHTGPADAAAEKKELDAAYELLRPAFQRAAASVQPRVDPRGCYAHFMASEGDDAALSSRASRRLDQLRDRARHDSSFPFALPPPLAVDAGSGDLRVVPASWRRYFQAIGVNYFAGRVAPSLSPGKIEVFGLLHVDEDDDDTRGAVEMVFDIRERWRHNKRHRQVNVALNTSDFYSRGFIGYGQRSLQRAVVAQQQAKTTADEPEKGADARTLRHPCFFSGYAASTTLEEAQEVELQGSGDAKQCTKLVEAHIARGNAACPFGDFCLLEGTTQPKPQGAFYATGVLRDAVLRASRVLEWKRDQRPQDGVVTQLQLPTPPLSALRDATDALCALSFDDVIGVLPTEGQADSLCLDLCYSVVLLERLGVQDVDERVYFVDRFEKQPVTSPASSGESGNGSGDGSSPELVAWVTGSFLYLEALQRKVSYSLESEILAEQLSAGLPLGWNLSLLVLVAALVALYWTTWRKTVAGRRSGSYHRVVNGGAKAKYQDTTQSIVFVDDARE